MKLIPLTFTAALFPAVALRLAAADEGQGAAPQKAESVDVQTASVQQKRVNFKDCYAEWSEGRLTVGNAQFERAWVAGNAGLVPVSYLLKNPSTEWLAQPTAASGKLDVKAASARRSAVGAEGLRIEAADSVIWVFPGASGTLSEKTAGTAGQPTSSSRDGSNVPGGIERPESPGAAPEFPGAETLKLAPPHLRVTQIGLMDQTDNHNELVWQREWLLMPNEAPFDVQGCVLVVENPLDGTGLAFLKFAPLPHARQDKRSTDFKVAPGSHAISTFFNGYPVATLGYRGGQAGRTRALHALQRCLREYRPGRDGLFLSNTWGDGSRDARINECFLLKEIEAGAALGVDVVQIDDGWQQGRSANSVAAGGKGVWNGYWAADPEFWNPNPERFPNGLKPVVSAARAKGMNFGLWFGPDSSNNAANWQKDADHLLGFRRELGINYFKMDSMKTNNAESLNHQRAMFDRMLEGSGGAMTFDLDVTAEIRPGYLGLPDIGPLFVENRYTHAHRYWPHQTLRNLWMLSQVIDPLRLRIEILNNARNTDQYKGDPLAPALYQSDTLFAIAMMANPLGWFEVSNLPPDYTARMKPLVATWKTERARMHGGTILPVGSAPDGVSWTGFISAAADGKDGYALLFRELNASAAFSLDLSGLIAQTSRATVIGGRGTATLSGHELTATVPEKLDFLWVKLE